MTTFLHKVDAQVYVSEVINVAKHLLVEELKGNECFNAEGKGSLLATNSSSRGKSQGRYLSIKGLTRACKTYYYGLTVRTFLLCVV